MSSLQSISKMIKRIFQVSRCGTGKHFELLILIIIYYYQKGRTIKVENYPKCWSSGDFLYLSSSIVITFRVALLFAHVLLYRAYLCNKTSSLEGQNIEYQRNTKCPSTNDHGTSQFFTSPVASLHWIMGLWTIMQTKLINSWLTRR